MWKIKWTTNLNVSNTGVLFFLGYILKYVLGIEKLQSTLNRCCIQFLQIKQSNIWRVSNKVYFYYMYIYILKHFNIWWLFHYIIGLYSFKHKLFVLHYFVALSRVDGMSVNNVVKYSTTACYYLKMLILNSLHHSTECRAVICIIMYILPV